MSRHLDAVGLIETAYASVPDDVAWLQRIADVLKDLDFGLGIAAFRVDLGQPGARKFEVKGLAATVPIEVPRQALIGSMPTVPATILERGLLSHPMATLGSTRAALLGEPFPALWKIWSRHNFGFDDTLAILGMSPDGTGAIISVPMPKRRRVPPRTLSLLARAAAHLASANRLRGALDGKTWGPEDPMTEAVLDSSGRVHHAVDAVKDNDARDLLCNAVRKSEKARGPLRRTDPEEATQLWKGLVDGCWSLVDHVDRDGKRFILVRRNEPDIRDPKALAPRERHVAALAVHGFSNKHIAYQLGISATTVSSHLGAALRKLSLTSRRELVQTFGGSQ
jgi:DNA-binding CsgD family transcriptional regulator